MFFIKYINIKYKNNIEKIKNIKGKIFYKNMIRVSYES